MRRKNKNKKAPPTIRLAIVLLCSSVFPTVIEAQTNCQEMIARANRALQAGRFETSIRVLNQTIESNCSLTDQTQAHRLLALSYIGADSSKAAVKFVVHDLIALNRKFSPSLNDPHLFKELVKQRKRHLAKKRRRNRFLKIGGVALAVVTPSYLLMTRPPNALPGPPRGGPGHN